MYIARIHRQHRTRFFIRESYQSGTQWQSRDLMDLGWDPASFIVYPGGSAFYVDMAVTDHLLDEGADPDPDELESLFWPFVRPDIRRRVGHFRTRSENLREARIRERDLRETFPLPHIFDRRRVHYLRYGQMDQGRIGQVSPKLFRVLTRKSRDEIEQYFIEAERVLKAHEFKPYIFVIFDLQRFFTERFARTMPQGLDADRVDDCFVDEICRLNRDPTFSGGMAATGRLNDYLVRYLVMHFDSAYPQDQFLENLFRDFKNRHRRYRPPKSVAVSMEEAARLFATDREALRRMGRSDLARLYRHRAKAYHPDQGGNKAEFIKLTEAYHRLLRTKR